MTVERRLFISTDADGNLALGGPWAMAEVKGTAVSDQVNATSTAAEVVAANASRKSLLIVNADAEDTVYLGVDGDVTTALGIPLPPGGYFTDDITNGAWWAITGGTTIDLRILEVSYA